MHRVVVSVLAVGAAITVGLGVTGQRAGAADALGHRGYGAFAWGGYSAGGNPLIDLGRRLFFDTRFSATGGTSCASCHHSDYAYAEPHRTSVFDSGKVGPRNAPSLLDSRYRSTLMWDGRFHSLEQQVFGPFARGEMGIGIEQAAWRARFDFQYISLFRTVFNSWPTPDGMARAIAEYERTLVSRDSRVDRYIAYGDDGALSSFERYGLDIFTNRAGCSNCHQLYPYGRNGGPSRPLLSDFRYHNIGTSFRGGRFVDIGRYELTGNPADAGAFRTPPLRNSVRSPPYMHDGRFSTLEEVVDFYDAGGEPNPNLAPEIRPLGLAEREKAALVSFLRALGSY